MDHVITWRELVRERGDANTLYPYAVETWSNLSEKGKEMIEFCHAMFGPGGRFPEVGNRWTYDLNKGVFAFKTETDRQVFLVAFSG